MTKLIPENKIHAGHRERMRAKLISHGKSIFDTYELLEMLLYYTIPYKDTNPIAKNLLSQFESLDGVLSASPEELLSVSGIGERSAEFLKDCNELAVILGAETVPSGGVDFGDFKSTGEYICSCFAKYPESTASVLVFDNGMRLIETRMILDDAYGSAAFKPKFFIDLALSNRASVMITANKSAYGKGFSTDAERMTTKMINTAISSVGIFHMEHYNISGNEFFSTLGRLPAFRSDDPKVLSFIESRRLLGEEGQKYEKL